MFAYTHLCFLSLAAFPPDPPSFSYTRHSYHQAGPVFHDAGKFWSCCPGTVKYDFDDFLKIPGCMQSSHLDGSPESVRAFEANARKREG